jgi:flavin reductase (DIM6/NTAB) family NADH-FMN oxidoreductase RutF
MTLLQENPGLRASREGAPPRPISADLFRSVMGQVCTPVSVVTAFDGHRPHGTTVSAFASQSLDPPMVLVSLAATSRLLSCLELGGRFALNVLSVTQADLAMRFAGTHEDKFRDQTWDLVHGAPCLLDAAAVMVCEISERLAVGDHVIVCGTVLHADSASVQPLTYHGRSFGTHSAA